MADDSDIDEDCNHHKRGIYDEGCGSGHHHEVKHYFGCLKVSERLEYFDKLEDKQKERLRNEFRRYARLRAFFESHDPEKTARMLVLDLETSLKEWRVLQLSSGDPSVAEPNLAPAPEVVEQDVKDLHKSPENDPDLKANVIFYDKSRSRTYYEPHSHPALPEDFPHQKISIKSLLFDKTKESNPLMMDCGRDLIRYIHLPANNMRWVEEAIARYYNEDRPDLNHPFQKPSKLEKSPKTTMLLRPHYWRNLQHGGRQDLPLHSRHMRPRCYTISAELELKSAEPENLVLYMPFLHWETDRRREKSAEAIRKTRRHKLSTILDVIETVGRTMHHEGAVPQPLVGIVSNSADSKKDRSMWSILNGDGKGKDKCEAKMGEKKQLEENEAENKKRKRLGRLLFHAAALAEAMDYATDERLVTKYLNAKAPLHPRRTLDQFYYWTLKDTRTRDRDQVVYRGTAPSRDLMHVYCVKRACEQCHAIVRKIPRVVMVDQLWMFILDKNTIITSFPKRWGRNKPDPSAIQKCIRTRLQAARDDDIHSVFDIALIIVDQCCRVFFDRMQPADLEPLVLDSFANAIGRVTERQARALTYFWLTTGHASTVYRSRFEKETTEMKKRLLDINPEGKLFLEIKDILDELNILGRVKKQQQKVANEFLKAVKQIQQGKDQKFKRTNWTKKRADDLSERFVTQIAEIDHLKEAAEHTSTALKDLLALKQQQASIVEAREAVKQAQETLRQGRAIMLFTIITIIFLPLSFFTSIFGMNTAELNMGLWTFNEEFIYMFPISFAIIAIALLLAFSSTVRTILSLLTNVFYTWVMTKTYLYKWWHNSHINKRLSEAENNIIADLKEVALKKNALSQLSWKQVKMLNAADELDAFLGVWNGPLKDEKYAFRKEQRRLEKERCEKGVEGEKKGAVGVSERLVPGGGGNGNENGNGSVANGLVPGHDDIDRAERGLRPTGPLLLRPPP